MNVANSVLWRTRNILKANIVHLFLSSFLFSWYHSPNFLGTPCMSASPVDRQSKAGLAATWFLKPLFRIPLEAWILLCVDFVLCVDIALRGADHSARGVRLSVCVCMWQCVQMCVIYKPQNPSLGHSPLSETHKHCQYVHSVCYTGNILTYNNIKIRMISDRWTRRPLHIP
jgi:hypothetical protein